MANEEDFHTTILGGNRLSAPKKIVVEPNNLGEDEQIQQLQVGQYPHIQMITSWFYYRCLQSADVLVLGSSHLSFTAQEANRHFDGEPDR